MYRLLFLVFLLGSASLAMAQKRKLPQNISSFSQNEYAPKLTADGRTLLYTSDYSPSGKPEMFISNALGNNQWTNGEMIEIPGRHMIAFGAYALSYDGNQLIYSSKKSPGIGGYDIRFRQKQGNGWAEAVNPGKPLNSALHELDPTLSADGKTLYFSRCETLEPSNGNCKLFSAEFLGDVRWKEPQEIKLDLASSSFVNPVILLDNQTLYFAALNSEGNYDFYMSRKNGTGWSVPIAMGFINTDAHDRYIGVTALGDVAYIHQEDERGYDLFMVKVPDEFQPAKVYYLEGAVSNLPARALVKATDIDTDQELVRLIIDQEKSTFGVYLPAGHQVDFSIETNEPGYGFYSEMLDLRDLSSSTKLVKDIALPTLQKDQPYPVKIAFASNTNNFAAGAEEELERLISLMKKNSMYRFDLEVYQASVTESNTYAYTLPEIRYDTLAWVTHETDTITNMNAIDPDSATVSDQLNPQVITVYHNDLTRLRADAIRTYLFSKGVPEDRFSTIGKGENRELDYSDEEITINQKVVLRLN